MSVRAGEVTASPLFLRCTCREMNAVWCGTTHETLAHNRYGALTSTVSTPISTRSHKRAAVPWDRQASAPAQSETDQAFCIQLRSAQLSRHTPGSSRAHSPDRTRRPTCDCVTPNASSCCHETTPHCILATCSMLRLLIRIPEALNTRL